MQYYFLMNRYTVKIIKGYKFKCIFKRLSKDEKEDKIAIKAVEINCFTLNIFNIP